MQRNNFDILHELENLKIAREKFNEYTRDTYKYVDKYNDVFPEGRRGGWDDTVDAFRHAFMQAHSQYKYGSLVSKSVASLHERNGNKYMGQSKEEEFMDEWNNKQGREIADEVSKDIKMIGKKLSDAELKDFIAYKIVQRIKSGELITGLEDAKLKMEKNIKKNKKRSINSSISKPKIITSKQKYDLVQDKNKGEKGTTTGQAAPVSTSYNSTVSNPVPNKSPEPKKSPSQKFSDTIRQKLKNKINANNKKINFNFSKSTTPKNSTNGHWVTMNGTHVFIEN